MIGWSGAVAHWAWHSTELGRNQAELGSPMELKTYRKTSEVAPICKVSSSPLPLAGSFKYFFFSSRKLGKIPILTHIFQRGWFNHQLASGDFLRKKSPNNTTELEPCTPGYTPSVLTKLLAGWRAGLAYLKRWPRILINPYLTVQGCSWQYVPCRLCRSSLDVTVDCRSEKSEGQPPFGCIKKPMSNNGDKLPTMRWV